MTLTRLTRKFRRKNCKREQWASNLSQHYFDCGSAHPLLQETFDDLMADYDVKKVVLYRENVFAVFVSMSRLFISGHYLTKNYDAISVTINICDLQSFIDNYEFHCAKYKDMTRGQGPLVIKYEDLCTDEFGSNINRLFAFLQVSAQVPHALPETVPQSSAVLSDVILNYSELEFAFRHTHYSKYLPKVDQLATPKAAKLSEDICDMSADYTWGLLVPIYSFASSFEDCRTQLTALRNSLNDTTTDGWD
jgi:hypothetical protein